MIWTFGSITGSSEDKLKLVSGSKKTLRCETAQWRRLCLIFILTKVWSRFRTSGRTVGSDQHWVFMQEAAVQNHVGSFLLNRTTMFLYPSGVTVIKTTCQRSNWSKEQKDKINSHFRANSSFCLFTFMLRRAARLLVCRVQSKTETRQHDVTDN